MLAKRFPDMARCPDCGSMCPVNESTGTIYCENCTVLWLDTDEVVKVGSVRNIAADRFPKQGPYLGKEVDVCFHYDLSCILGGTVVRDDDEEPGVMVIRLDDGRFVLSAECMYTLRKA